MPWPKGVPFPKEMIAKRSASIVANGKRRKKSRVVSGVTCWPCGSCGKHKSSNLFHLDKRTSNGLKSQCKKCHSECYLRTRNKDLNRQSKRLSEFNRRARKNGSKISQSSLDALTLILGDDCLKCGATENMQWDHITPLSKKGCHSVGNLQPLCRGCNECKQASYADYRSDEQKKGVIEFEVINQNI